MKRPSTLKVGDTSRLHVILPDIHHPEHNKPAVGAVFSFMEDKKEIIDGVILLGDNQHCSNFSRHTKGKPRLRERGGIEKDFRTFNNDILKPIEAIIRPGTKKTFFLGNHEDWLEQWLDEHPEFEGLVSIDQALKLTERGWEVVPRGEHRQVGKAYLMHGDQIGSGSNVAKKLVESFCATCIMGHVHAFNVHTKSSQAKDLSKWLGVTLPTLGTMTPEYAKGRPNSFINGFGIVELWPNDFINIYVPIIFDGQFSFAGKIYSRTK
jgi:UDP-2,3-diacylglucosamine pyrophosphatase LpxH